MKALNRFRDLCVMDQPPFLPAQRRGLDLRRRLLPRMYNQLPNARSEPFPRLSL